MSTILKRVLNYLNPKYRKLNCGSSKVVEKKESLLITEQSFLEVYHETRNLANDIIEKLEDNRKRVKALYTAFNAASDLIIIFDAYGKIVYANVKFLDAYGFQEEFVIDKNIRELFNSSLPEFNQMWFTISKNNTWEGSLSCYDSIGQIQSHHSKILPIMNGMPEPIFYVCSQSKT